MVYIIVEIGCNYNGDINFVKKMVDVVVFCGVDVVKFQIFKVEKFIFKFVFKVEY